MPVLRLRCSVFGLWALGLSHACLVQAQDPQIQVPNFSSGQTPSSLFPIAQYPTEVLARQWKLKNKEIERYKQLMITEQSYSAPGITPYEVLGKHARSVVEMQRYARKTFEASVRQHIMSLEWAIVVSEQSPSRDALALEVVDGSKIIRDYLERQGITRDAYAKDAGEQVLGLQELLQPASERTASDQSGVLTNRYRLFVDLMDCEARCVGLWNRARSKQKLGQIDAIDVVVMDHEGARVPKDVVVQWAKAQDIQPSELEPPARAVTLNFQSTAFNEILAGRKAPLLVSIDGSTVE